MRKTGPDLSNGAGLLQGVGCQLGMPCHSRQCGMDTGVGDWMYFEFTKQPSNLGLLVLGLSCTTHAAVP
jgi:hypothetical protein